MSKPIVNSPAKDLMPKQASPTSSPAGSTKLDSDLSGMDLIIGVKIGGESSELLDELGKK